jgi:hypothetical protein
VYQDREVHDFLHPSFVLLSICRPEGPFPKERSDAREGTCGWGLMFNLERKAKSNTRSFAGVAALLGSG